MGTAELAPKAAHRLVPIGLITTFPNPTVTVAKADLVVSATLVAATVYVPAVAGAV